MMSTNQARQEGEEKTVRQGRPPADLDVNKIIQLYTEKRLTVRQIADEMGVSHTTVARRIAENNGHLRTWRLPGEE